MFLTAVDLACGFDICLGGLVGREICQFVFVDKLIRNWAVQVILFPFEETALPTWRPVRRKDFPFSFPSSEGLWVYSQSVSCLGWGIIVMRHE